MLQNKYKYNVHILRIYIPNQRNHYNKHDIYVRYDHIIILILIGKKN